MVGVPSAKKPKKLPPRGEKGRFVKTGTPISRRELVPQIVEMPEYSPHRVGIGERIDWERELSREVLPPRRAKSFKMKESNKLGWGIIAAGGVGIIYALTRLPDNLKRR